MSLMHFCVSVVFTPSKVEWSANQIFLFDSERVSNIMFNLRPPVKMADFHDEVAFISVFEGIRDIFEAWFIIQLCF
jgi:hypothetical protein